MTKPVSTYIFYSTLAIFLISCPSTNPLSAPLFTLFIAFLKPVSLIKYDSELFPQATLFYTNRESRGGGVLIAVHNSIPCTQLRTLSQFAL